MGHDDPKNPHHHHSHQHGQHQHDSLISQTQRRPAAAHEDGGEHEHQHGHDEPKGHVHAHAPGGSPVSGRPAAMPHGAENPAPRVELAHGAGVGKTLHFDCFSGLAGDMIVGALLDLGVPRDAVQRALSTLPLAGYSVGAVDKVMSSIAATKFVVDVESDQPYRTYRDIRSMLEQSSLADGIKRRALATFRVLAIAEGKIHRIAADDVHFHEVGAVDAIVDIVSACAGFEWLGARISCAPLPMGRGFTKSEHGIIPLPAPAVVEVLAGVPTEQVALDFELVTPTGAALIRANATEFTRWPSLRPVTTGFGAGTRTLPDRPNVLRAVLGEPIGQRSALPAATTGHASEFLVLEANLDDATGELIANVVDALLRDGALDAWTTSIGMKKGRPGWMVSALVRSADADRVTRILLTESTTLGVRVRPSERVERPRRTVKVDTEYGAIDVKVSDGDGLPVTAKPEHDVVQAIARERGVPVKSVYAAAMAAFYMESH